MLLWGGDPVGSLVGTLSLTGFVILAWAIGYNVRSAGLSSMLLFIIFEESVIFVFMEPLYGLPK